MQEVTRYNQEMPNRMMIFCNRQRIENHTNTVGDTPE